MHKSLPEPVMVNIIRDVISQLLQLLISTAHDHCCGNMFQHLHVITPVTKRHGFRQVYPEMLQEGINSLDLGAADG